MIDMTDCMRSAPGGGDRTSTRAKRTPEYQRKSGLAFKGYKRLQRLSSNPTPDLAAFIVEFSKTIGFQTRVYGEQSQGNEKKGAREDQRNRGISDGVTSVYM